MGQPALAVASAPEALRYHPVMRMRFKDEVQPETFSLGKFATFDEALSEAKSGDDFFNEFLRKNSFTGWLLMGGHYIAMANVVWVAFDVIEASADGAGVSA